MPAGTVDYELQVHDELPPATATQGGSVLEDQLKRIKFNAELHHPKWARIGRYNNAPAAASAKMTLQRRHGSSPEVEGWRFETRRIDNGEATGLFAQYNGEWIVPGKREENTARYQEYKERQAEARRVRLETVAKADAEKHAKAQPVAAKRP